MANGQMIAGKEGELQPTHQCDMRVADTKQN